MKIRNYETLVSGGDIKTRQVVLEILEGSLRQLDSYPLIRRLLELEGSILKIGEHRWNLGTKRRIFVIGAGKACNAMALAVEEVLGRRISNGLVIVKRREDTDVLRYVELVEGGHPIPSEEGFAGTQRILKLVDGAGPEDLFIGLISGGSSALMNCPLQGITLEEEMRVTEALLKSGARIQEINAVRRHISATNGGRLAQRIEAKGAEMINLIISDGVGGKPTTDPTRRVEFRATPVAPDPTTLRDARNVLAKYDLVSHIPRSVIEYLNGDDPVKETPKVLGDRIHHFVIERPADACEAARKTAQRKDIPVLVLTTVLQGESSHAGCFLASVAKEVVLNNRPLSPPCVLVAGGETTTRIDGEAGLGGPSQELALGFALEVAGLKGICIGAMDTDGTDGPTETSGGITDGMTVERAQERGLSIYESLRNHDSSRTLQALGDEIVTGNTGTNVCDLNVIFVGAEAASDRP